MACTGIMQRGYLMKSREAYVILKWDDEYGRPIFVGVAESLHAAMVYCEKHNPKNSDYGVYYSIEDYIQ